MVLDPDRVVAAIAAALASSATSALALVSTVFGMPPPTRREVLRSLAETVVGVFLAVLVGYGFGAPMAELLSGAAGLMRIKVKVDSIAGAILVGAVVLRVVPLLVKLAEVRAQKALDTATDRRNAA